MAGLAIATRLDGAPALADRRGGGDAFDLPVSRNGFEPTRLPRHGMRPLMFQGRLLVQAGMRAEFGMRSHVALHETDRGDVVGAIRHVFAAAGVPDLTYAAVFSDADSLICWLHAHDPLADAPIEALLPAGLDAADATDHPGLLIRAAPESAMIRARFRALLTALLAPCNDPSTKGRSP